MYGKVLKRDWGELYGNSALSAQFTYKSKPTLKKSINVTE
jgi:hypothetical protein